MNLSFQKAFYFGNMKIAEAIPVYKDKARYLIAVTIDQYLSSLI